MLIESVNSMASIRSTTYNYRTIIQCISSMSAHTRFLEFQSREAVVRAKLQRTFTPELAQCLELQITKAHRSPDATHTVHWLRKAATTIGIAVAPLAACKSACSACCHIPVMLLASEAKVIAKELGITLKFVPPEKRNQPPPKFQGEDFACPLLKEDKCSIYESRPLVCRTLYNLDRDPLLCQHTGESNLVPYFDATQFNHHAIAALHQNNDDFTAELRDFIC